MVFFMARVGIKTYQRDALKVKQLLIAKANAHKEIELTQDQQRAQNDFEFFLWHLTKRFGGLAKTLQEHQREWLNAILTNESNGTLWRVAGPDLSILAPREAGKSVLSGWLMAC